MKPKGGQRERETLETHEGARKREIRRRKKEGERVRGERGKCASEQKREGDDGQRVRVTEKGREGGRKGEQSVDRERERE